HPIVWGKAEPGANLFETHLVVTWIFVPPDVSNLPGHRIGAGDQFDEIQLSIVLCGVPHVENLTANAFDRGVEYEPHSPGGIRDVEVRTPERLAEHLEVTPGPEVSDELIDCEIESHAIRNSVEGCNW